jgi:hypothetical protein
MKIEECEINAKIIKLEKEIEYAKGYQDGYSEAVKNTQKIFKKRGII